MRDDIWLRHHKILGERHKKLEEVMSDYDNEVYLPALKVLREDCKKDGGHRDGRFDDNGFGWSWFNCNRCGARYNLIGPNGQERAEDE